MYIYMNAVPAALAISSPVEQEKQSTTTFTPGVVEPSFGIDRILFSVLEHTYYARPKAACPA